MADDLKSLGFEDETDQLKALGFEEEQLPAAAPPAEADETSISSTPYLPAKPPSLHDNVRAFLQASGADPFGVIPDEKTARGAVASLVQGPARGWGDELIGKRAELDQILKNWRLPPDKRIDPRWVGRQARDEVRGVERDFRDEHPALGLGLTAAGSALFGDPVQIRGGGLARYAPAAVEGALSGAGASESTEDMGLGAAVGMPLGVAGQVLGEIGGELAGAAAGRIGPALSRFSEGRAVKAATGQNKRVIKSMVERGLVDADTGTIDVVGRDLLDTGSVTAGASTRDIMERAAANADTYGRAIGDSLDELDALTPPGFRLSADELADQAEQRFILPLLQGSHGDQQLAQRLMPEINALRAQGMGPDGQVPLAALEAFRRGLDRSITPGGWASTEPTPVAQALRNLRGFVNDAIETRAQRVADDAGSDAAQRYLDAKRMYGSMRLARDAARDQVSGQLSNRFTSPSDLGTGMTGMILGSLASGGSPAMAAATGLAMGGLNHLGRMRGNQVLAAGTNLLGQSDWLDQLARTNPEALGRWGQYLGAAASQSPEALSMAKYDLGQTDPDYQQQRRKQGDSQR